MTNTTKDTILTEKIMADDAYREEADEQEERKPHDCRECYYISYGTRCSNREFYSELEILANDVGHKTPISIRKKQDNPRFCSGYDNAAQHAALRHQEWKVNERANYAAMPRWKKFFYLIFFGRPLLT